MRKYICFLVFTNRTIVNYKAIKTKYLSLPSLLIIKYLYSNKVLKVVMVNIDFKGFFSTL